MTDNEEGNRLIAEFMNIPKCGRCSDCGAYQYGPAIIYHPKEMRYHEKWDWLMPVAHKCFNECTEEDREFKGLVLFELGLLADIETVYSAVIEFIQWYSEQ
jgi:hypothetical protein